MKDLKKIVVVSFLVISLAFSACCIAPPMVSRDDLETARREALEAEAHMAQLQTEKTELETEILERQEKLLALQEMERALN